MLGYEHHVSNLCTHIAEGIMEMAMPYIVDVVKKKHAKRKEHLIEHAEHQHKLGQQQIPSYSSNDGVQHKVGKTRAEIIAHALDDCNANEEMKYDETDDFFVGNSEGRNCIVIKKPLLEKMLKQHRVFYPNITEDFVEKRKYSDDSKNNRTKSNNKRHVEGLEVWIAPTKHKSNDESFKDFFSFEFDLEKKKNAVAELSTRLASQMDEHCDAMFTVVTHFLKLQKDMKMLCDLADEKYESLLLQNYALNHQNWDPHCTKCGDDVIGFGYHWCVKLGSVTEATDCEEEEGNFFHHLRCGHCKHPKTKKEKFLGHFGQKEYKLVKDCDGEINFVNIPKSDMVALLGWLEHLSEIDCYSKEATSKTKILELLDDVKDEEEFLDVANPKDPDLKQMIVDLEENPIDVTKIEASLAGREKFTTPKQSYETFDYKLINLGHNADTLVKEQCLQEQKNSDEGEKASNKRKIEAKSNSRKKKKKSNNKQEEEEAEESGNDDSSPEEEASGNVKREIQNLQLIVRQHADAKFGKGRRHPDVGETSNEGILVDSYPRAPNQDINQVPIGSKTHFDPSSAVNLRVRLIDSRPLASQAENGEIATARTRDLEAEKRGSYWVIVHPFGVGKAVAWTPKGGRQKRKGINLEGPFPPTKEKALKKYTSTLTHRHMEQLVEHVNAEMAKETGSDRKYAWLIEQKHGQIVNIPVGYMHAVHNHGTCLKVALDRMPHGTLHKSVVSRQHLKCQLTNNLTQDYMHVLELAWDEVKVIIRSREFRKYMEKNCAAGKKMRNGVELCKSLNKEAQLCGECGDRSPN